MDDLPIPDFLKGSRAGPKPRWTSPWRHGKAQRPEGAKWEEAERWEVYLPHKLVAGDGHPAVGTRLVWVIAGKTWTELRDAEGYIKIATADWNRLAQKGRKIE
jgi:hypothetical protein